MTAPQPDGWKYFLPPKYENKICISDFHFHFFQVKPINVAEVKAVCGEYLFIGFPRIMF